MEPELRVLTLPQLRCIYDEELKRTFPAAELMPYETMVHLMELGRYDMEGFFEGSILLGYAIICVDPNHDYALIDYLGIVTQFRNSGLGTKLLAQIKVHCCGYRGILAEAEAPAGPVPEPGELVARRLHFYTQCGFVRLPYDMSLFGVPYQTLIYPADNVTLVQMVLEAHQRLYHNQFNPNSYDRFVQLPLGNEPLRPFSPWEE